jgi:hypothetical protein
MTPAALLPLMHISVDHLSPDLWWVPRPAESHHTFGTGFILVGSLMMAEVLAGAVWHRSRLRTMMLPAVLIMLGWGMMAVTFIDPEARLVHLSMGLPLTIGGWAEAQYRMGKMSRRVADTFLVPALLLAAVDTAGFHLTGPVLSGGVITHGVLAVMTIVIAGVRLYQAQLPTSVRRGLALSACVILVGMNLYLDAFFL